MCGRSVVGASASGDSWSTREQEHFIELILPHINGKCLTEEEVQLIRAEAEQANLPPECVDRLIEENNQRHQPIPLKRQNADFETIEDVDESDNILAYFSRMNTLKQGGHFPQLNTDAISDFVEHESTFTNESIEVDLDVGYVNTTFNLDHSAILHEDSSWVDSDNDDALGISMSTAIGGHTNRYAPYQPKSKSKRDKDAFASLLVGARSAETDLDEETETTERTRYDVDLNEPMPSMEETSTSFADTQADSDWAPAPTDSNDWAPATKLRRRTYRYGYERDLEEWRKKRDIALWQPKEGSNTSSLFSCQAMAESVVAEELNGLLWGGSKRPPRLRGITAVRKLVQETGERKKRQQERNQLRHVPIKHEKATRPWQLAYRERCKPFTGYIGIDQYSLMQTAAAVRPMDSRDQTPWETRDVRQHFLNDQSISLSRNWFGRLRKKNGNDLVRYRPCRPPTMGMPANTCSYDSEDDWSDAPSRTTGSKSRRRKGKKLNKTASMSFTSDDDASECHSDEDSTGKTSRENDSNGRLEVDFSTMISSMMTGANETFTSYSKLTRRDYGMAWMSEDEDDIESVGVSAIEDADSGDDQRSKPSSSRPGASVTIESVTETDRYVSSFSESSTSDNSSTTSNPLSTSTGSYVTGDSQSTSSYSSMDAPECGTLVNVKSKLGERVSRVTPDHTSHLLRSRFRKKYLRHAPFDKYMS